VDGMMSGLWIEYPEAVTAGMVLRLSEMRLPVFGGLFISHWSNPGMKSMTRTRRLD